MKISGESKLKIFNPSVLKIVGVLLISLLAILLLWQGKSTSVQASNALVAKVYFDGEYRIEDGEWKKIVKGEHIPSTQGDVTLRGNFHLLSPDGDYGGLYTDVLPLAFYTDHINLTFYENENEPYVIDHEDPLYGASACGVNWIAHTLAEGNTSPIEIVVHNPHSYGNETAIDELLANVSIWYGIDFEKDVLESGEPQRNIGQLFVIVSIMFFGTALFSTLIHIKKSKIIWVFGAVILLAGTYFIYKADGISFWNNLIISNTIILGFSMILYMLFVSLAIVHFLTSTKKIGNVTLVFIGVVDGLIFILPMLTDVYFYDLWPCWAVIQIIANAVLFGCLIKEFFTLKQKERWPYLCSTLPLISFALDAVMTKFGVWEGGLSSKYVFILFFVVAIVVVLKIIPHSINVLAKANELETEKAILNAKLTESKVSTMMSQIRPHFIYNTLGSIEQLCNIDPPKAGELVHNFAKYLRGNFGELDNTKPILMSREMEHVRHYISIEKVRFPDMTFLFEMNSGDFSLPALTVQPIVENAIKHGLMKLPKGGTIRVVSYETDIDYCISVEDDGAGFDTTVLLDEREHVGIRNIRGRLNAMVNGTLEINSTIGEGTKVLIKIPKEDM